MNKIYMFHIYGWCYLNFKEYLYSPYITKVMVFLWDILLVYWIYTHSGIITVLIWHKIQKKGYLKFISLMTKSFILTVTGGVLVV